jgi:UDP-N-acetylglucosamine--N-acetylmuramyl-(pentapeptide) pyrophosphoryl-undecaprenol N-acetylglucosamine transferase
MKTFLDAGLNIIWQTGTSENLEQLKQVYPDTSRICIRQFISEMPEAYAASDLVAARAGASTLAELSTIGKAAILVPYPFAAMDHQSKNAIAYRDKGAAQVITDAELPNNFESSVLSLMNDDERREEMAKKMHASENITARNVVAEYLISQITNEI